MRGSEAQRTWLLGAVVLLVSASLAGPGQAATVHAAADDGDLVRTPSNGRVYRIVGGAPLWISRCDYTAGCSGVEDVPDLDDYAPYPRDGALARNVDDGAIYRFAGGAPLWISSCEYEPGCGGVVEVDTHAFAVHDHMRATPADGTYLQVEQSDRYLRVAGGAPLEVTDCFALDGECDGAVQIDSGTLEQGGSPSGPKRLFPVPADGTVLHGQPSGERWSIRGGMRFGPYDDLPGVEINDETLAAFPPALEPPDEPPPDPRPAPTLVPNCGITGYLDLRPDYWSAGCTGGALNVYRLRWAHYGRRSARATGQARLRRPCGDVPCYKAGTYRAVARLSMWRPRRCTRGDAAGERFFSRVRLRIRYRRGNPFGRRPGWHTYRFRIRAYGGRCSYSASGG